MSILSKLFGEKSHCDCGCECGEVSSRFQIVIGELEYEADAYQLILGPEMNVVGVSWIKEQEDGRPYVAHCYQNSFIVIDNAPVKVADDAQYSGTEFN